MKRTRNQTIANREKMINNMQELALLFDSRVQTLTNKWRVASVNRDTQVGRPTYPSRLTDPHESVDRHRRPGQPTARPRSTVRQVPVNRVRSATTSPIMTKTSADGHFSVGMSASSPQYPMIGPGRIGTTQPTNPIISKFSAKAPSKR